MYLISPTLPSATPTQNPRPQLRQPTTFSFVAKRSVLLSSLCVALFGALAIGPLALTTASTNAKSRVTAEAPAAITRPASPTPIGRAMQAIPSPTPGTKTSGSADFPITIHVTGSYWDTVGLTNTLDVTIDSVSYQLITRSTNAYLALGDYPARIDLGHRPPKVPPYMVRRAYELQYPDGKTGYYTVTGQATD